MLLLIEIMRNFLWAAFFVFATISVFSQTRTLTSDGKLRESVSPLSKVKKVIPKGSIVTNVIDVGSGYYSVQYGDISGYMNELYWIPVLNNESSQPNKNSNKVIYTNTEENFSPNSSTITNSSASNNHQKSTIKMTKTKSGLFEVPVMINGVLKIFFIMDSGASEVSISPDVALTLLRTKTISDDDWLEGEYYRFADGSVAKSERFKLDEIEIGDDKLYNIVASISNSINAPMLLGQNVLSKLGKIVIDYNNNTLEIIR